ncbi:MAG TPA: START-like domain-containing protein [Paludibacter sp.]|nr:START-like domain-containing protein [Paludibacter sp.]
MGKKKIEVEYTFKQGSLPVLWNSISTPLGLSEWFAEGVTVVGNEYTFMWDKNDQTATLLNIKQNSNIRFQWKEDEGTDIYFEMRIVSNAITGDNSLLVTDFAETSDIEDTKFLWNHLVETLKRKTGM